MTVYVPLLDEGTAVWRPVEAEQVGDDVFRLSPVAVIPEGEMWRFLPGEVVRCERKQLSGGNVWVAVGG